MRWALGLGFRRSFHGPGMVNFDLALRDRSVLGIEGAAISPGAFNTFNHAQFFGPVAVDGDFNSNLFGQVVKALRRGSCRSR
jgi:hypothetical protein